MGKALPSVEGKGNLKAGEIGEERAVIVSKVKAIFSLSTQSCKRTEILRSRRQKRRK